MGFWISALHHGIARKCCRSLSLCPSGGMNNGIVLFCCVVLCCVVLHVVVRIGVYLMLG